MALVPRPFSAVLQDIVGDIQAIIRAEMRLAKTEVTESLGKVRTAVVLCGVGAVVAILSAIVTLLSIVYALSLVIPAWAAALTIGAVMGLIAVMLLQLGIKGFKTIHAAPKTAATLKENIEWAKPLTK